MRVDDEQLSAFLDGELPPGDARALEAALEEDAGLRARLEGLMAADTLARDAFAAMLDEPVPLGLAGRIRSAPAGAAANVPAPPRARGWLTAAAAALALAVGGAGGYVTGLSRSVEVAAAPGWLADIADYHAVYAAQGRHLVEVGADEADHIRTWLSASVGAEVRIPDLTAHGLDFRGARLLVAAGKPVAQLMYTDAADRVVALCLIATDTPNDGFSERTIGAFDLVSWGGAGANFVVVGDSGRSDLAEIAETAATEV